MINEFVLGFRMVGFLRIFNNYADITFSAQDAFLEQLLFRNHYIWKPNNLKVVENKKTKWPKYVRISYV